MFTITKEFHLSASHVLDGLPDGHQCGRLHGHNYVVEMVLQGTRTDATGFVRDYGDLGDVKTFLDGQWDHRHLNDHPAFVHANPTAEHMAQALFDQFADQLPELVAVRVSETPKTWAEYRGRVLG